MPFDKEQDAYRELRSILTERSRKWTLWCGAGLSRPAGLPGWRELRVALLDAMVDKARGLDDAAGAKILRIARDIEREVNPVNPWIAFQRYKEALGDVSFRASIHAKLGPAPAVQIPESYRLLWRLRPQGVLNLNLDQLATRAFHIVHPGAAVVEFNGHQIADLTHVLQGPGRFICNLHGVDHTVSSWVFTYDDLKALLENEAYKNFVSSILSTSTVVFVGLTPEDVAVGSHLERLQVGGVDYGIHYWLTDRRDEETDKWAQAHSLRRIVYKNEDGSHHQLVELLTDLNQFIPEEPGNIEPVPPLPVGAVAELPEPAALAREATDKIRILLNGYAARLLDIDGQTSPSDDAIAKYEDFCARYDEPIYRAYYTTTTPGQNDLFGYRLEEYVAKGFFGIVYRAIDPDQHVVAVKVLHNEIRSERRLIQSFRRGVRAMAILERHHVDGVVGYRTAAEIPAFVVMDWVDGPSLATAVEAKRLRDWDGVLRVGVELARILETAHAVPERVLHRDLRPSNVMLPNFWSPDGEWSVVVLDFDLSWYQGAYDLSLERLPHGTGYHAPEQRMEESERRRKRISTRNTAVDSFGLGMLLFYVISGRDPDPGHERHRDWAATVYEAARRLPSPRWISVPSRVARVILDSTREAQSDRLDVGQMHAELRRLHEAQRRPASVQSADLVAEEIAARSDAMGQYDWDEGRHAAFVAKPTGLRIELTGLEASRELGLHVSRPQMGHEAWGALSSKAQKSLRDAESALRARNWRIEYVSTERANPRLDARLSVTLAAKELERTARDVDQALSFLRFE